MQFKSPRDATVIWAVAVFASAFVFVASIVGPRPAFATLCHQLAGRSFVVEGHLFAVCHRCTGIYSGIFLGLLFVAIPAARHFVSRFGLALIGTALILVLLDVGLDVLTIASNTPASRVLTGLTVGLSGGTFLGSALLGIGRCAAHEPSRSAVARIRRCLPQITDNR